MSTKGRPTRGRPSEDAAATLPFEVECRGRDDIPAQIRRRRAAASRCAPLSDGRQDPLSLPKGARLRSLHVEVGRRSAWIHGDKVFELLDAVGIERRQWDHLRRVWCVPVQFADDVISWAEWRQRRVVTCEAVER